MITGGTDRNPRTISLLRTLAEAFAAGVFISCPTQTCVSYSQPSLLGLSYGGKNLLLDEADVILIIDTDLPWLDVAGNAPKAGAKVFVIDSDPLKSGMGWAHIDADMVCRADTETALSELLAAVKQGNLSSKVVGREERWTQLQKRHDEWIRRLEVDATMFKGARTDRSTAATVPNAFHILQSVVRSAVCQHADSQKRDLGATIWLNEAASNIGLLFNHIRMTDEDLARGSMVYTCGGSGLGWVLGGSVGAALALGQGLKNKPELIVAVVGDGTFIFGIPSAAYWMARRYNTVCNSPSNGGFLPNFHLYRVSPSFYSLS